jgi:hypothetical protein
MIEMLRIYSKGFLKNVTIEELPLGVKGKLTRREIYDYL